MVYQHSKSMNKIVSGSKKQKFNRDDSWSIRTWWRRHVDTTRISLSNKYFVSLSLTHYQLFFVFIWIYFGITFILWGVFYILAIPFIALWNKLISKSNKTRRI